MGAMQAKQLLAKYPLISDQINKDQLLVILSELEKILQSNREGAVVEFGCYIGTTSLFIRRLLDAYHDEREFHVYDSFAGLPEKTSQDDSRVGEQFTGGELAVSKKQFLHEFQKARLTPPIIHKGWFSDLSSTEVPPLISFAFLDGDFYESIKDSLKLVLPCLASAATVVFDDYAREALPGVEKAARELLSSQHYQAIQTNHNLGILHL